MLSEIEIFKLKNEIIEKQNKALENPDNLFDDQIYECMVEIIDLILNGDME